MRDILSKLMKGHWEMTWHEDREISPGVPDLHFHMNEVQGDVACGGRYEFRIGWLELKSVDEDVSPSNRIGIEPSQHAYFRRWFNRMDMFFLVRVKRQIYLIPGEKHSALAFAGSTEEVANLSVANFPQEEIGHHLPDVLRNMTRI
ncbi:MAG: hypothetical protein ACRC8N_00510 [Aeromonas veronii]